MNEKTNFIYENAFGKIEFAFDSDFWITDIDGASSLDVSISSSQGVNQIGSTVSGQSIQPVTMSVSGCMFGNTEVNREKMLNIIAPGVDSTFSVILDEVKWSRTVIPSKTPIIEAGNGCVDFQFKLYSAYPYWTNNTSEGKGLNGLIPTFKFPFNTAGTWYISEFSDQMLAEVVNEGNVESSVRVTITARANGITNPTIYNLTTGQNISLIYTMNKGETITINTTQGVKKINIKSTNGTSKNGFKWLKFGSDMNFCLKPGINTLYASAETNENFMDIMVYAPKGVKSGV